MDFSEPVRDAKSTVAYQRAYPSVSLKSLTLQGRISGERFRRGASGRFAGPEQRYPSGGSRRRTARSTAVARRSLGLDGA